MKYQGWLNRLVSFTFGSVGVFTAFSASAAGLVTVRNIEVTQPNQVEITLDSVVPKGMIALEYVRDNVQISVKNSSIYPAKMMHVENSVFHKVFAYQYSPELVRVRFTVQGEAKALQEKMKWSIEGKKINISFPSVATAQLLKNEEESAAPEITKEKEESLLARVLDNEPKAEAKPAQESAKANPETTRSNRKNLGKPEPQLANSKNEPRSLGKSLLVMLAIVGALGIILFWVRSKNKKQAKKVGQGFWTNLLPQGMKKSRSFIEVLAQHPLGPKQSIVVVRIRGQQFVLGATEGNVQLITQLDSDENEIDVLDQANVAESIGKFFGSKTVTQAPSTSFSSLLGESAAKPKAQTPVSASVPSSAYMKAPANVPIATPIKTTSIRDQIRRKLEAQV